MVVVQNALQGLPVETPSPYDDGWLIGIDCRMAEHQLNHPATESMITKPRAVSLTVTDDQTLDLQSVERVRKFMLSSST